MKPSLYFSDRVYRIDHDGHKEAIGFALAIAGTSLAALLSIACIDNPSEKLRLASVYFSAALPLSLFHGIISVFVAQGGWSTLGSRIPAFLGGLSSHMTVFAGIALVVGHISDISLLVFWPLAGATTIFMVLFAGRHHATCERLEMRNHEGLPKIQAPLERKE